jgi:hypothetical protein
MDETPNGHRDAVSAKKRTSAAQPNAGRQSPPAYVRSLTVANFRCFRDSTTLDLTRSEGSIAQWTVILGENGVGKTSMLQAFVCLQPTKLTQASGDVSYVPVAGSYWRPEPAFLDHVKDAYVASPRIRVISLLADIEIGQQMSVHGNRGEPISLTVGVNVMTRSTGAVTEDIGGLIFYGYGAGRTHGSLGLADSRTAQSFDHLVNEDAKLLNAEEWLLQADYAARRGIDGARRQYDRVKDELTRLLPDVTDLKIDALQQANGGVETPVVMAKTPYGWVQLRSLSLGYRAMLTWTVDLASRLFDRYPDSDDPLAEPAVVLVDEIDLHLHPRWQREIIPFLSGIFKNTQFIVTAHSPLIVQAAPEDTNIVLLRRDGDHVVIDNHMTVLRNARIDQILTSDLFGLETARPPQIQKALLERDALLAKSVLSEADENRLAELDSEIGDLPTAETASDQDAMDIVRRAAELLKTS